MQSKHLSVCGLLLFGLIGGCGKPSEAPATSASSVSTAAAATASAASPVQPQEVVTSSGIEMVYVPAGEFMMGSSSGNADEAPPHKVKLTGFLMDKYEVNQEMLAKVQLPNPSHWNEAPKRPVERVRWRDAKQYCNERSIAEGLKPCYNEKTPDWDCDYAANGYRLPTEAEWEYAARAGTQGDYEFGAADKLRSFAWYAENANEQTHPVGQKKPNRWGIYDLYGNVSEWCEDVYSPDYYKSSPAADPVGPSSPGKDVQRVMRGGSWKSSPEMCRVSFRQGQKTGDTDACFYTDYCGFRCVRRPGPGELEKMQRPK